MATVLERFNLAPVLCSYNEITLNKFCRECSFFKKEVVSSAYSPILKEEPKAPGKRKPSMFVEALTLHARTSTQST